MNNKNETKQKMNRMKKCYKPNYTYTLMHHLLFQMKLFLKTSSFHLCLPFRQFCRQWRKKKRNYRKSFRWTIAQTCQQKNDLANACFYFFFLNTPFTETAAALFCFHWEVNRFFIQSVIQNGNDLHQNLAISQLKKQNQKQLKNMW